MSLFIIVKMKNSNTFFKPYYFIHIFKFFEKEIFCERFRNTFFIEKAFFNCILENNDVEVFNALKISMNHFDRNIIIFPKKL